MRRSRRKRWQLAIAAETLNSRKERVGVNVKSRFCFFTIPLLLCLLTGCSMSEELAEWASGKANDALEVVGSGIQEALDDLHDAEYRGGPFENNLESARAYLLEQLQEKYGMEFAVVGDEDLVNYGPFAGASHNSPCITDNVSGCSGQLCSLLFQRGGRGLSLGIMCGERLCDRPAYFLGDAGNGENMDSRGQSGRISF